MNTVSTLSASPRPSRNNHAIVIGGSIAGMTVAQILTRHFERVTIIERDRLPATPDFRKGAPHARHAHILLGRGQEILEGLFPGLRQDLLAQGAVTVNMGSDLALFNSGAWGQPFPSAINMIGCSRPLIEDALRRQLLQNPQVQLCQEQEVLGLTTDGYRQCATGVRLRDRHDPAAPETRLAADLVVDASGRESHAPQWLTDLGYVAPEETVVNAFAGYASRIYRRPPHLRESWKAMYSMVSPPTFSRGGVILPMEGDLWQVTVMGMAKDYPPTDEAGFLAFLRGMPSPRMYEALKDAEPVTAPYGYRRAENRMRYYERLPRYLENFLVAGDAVYALNPVYGQGMTVAAIGSLTLDQCLHQQRRRHPDGDLAGLAQAYQRQLARAIADPWQMATGQDIRWPGTEGGLQPDAVTRLIQRYLDRVLRTMPHNPVVAEAFYHVQNMLKPPTSLFHPRILWHVLRQQPHEPTAPAAPLAEVQTSLSTAGD
jgi:2-polyprenyl-6-methoxyphenol hydroxylase-like FAD-dependent oxidoreductase